MNIPAMQASSRLEALWRRAKRWRHLPLGPIRLTYKFTRASPRRRTGDVAHLLSYSSLHRDAGLPLEGLSDDVAARNYHARGVAVIAGVGPGLGQAAAVLLARKGLRIALVSRSGDALDALASHLEAIGTTALAFPCDVTDERAVMRVMRDIEDALGPPELVIYAVQSFCPGTLLSTDAAAFEECWRGNCLGAFIVSREAAKTMCRIGRGTILFAGATSGTIGRKGYVNLAIGKFGLRALAQVIARELAPEGIHVAHVVIDGDITDSGNVDEGPKIEARELAELFWMLHMQPKSCWSSEVDVRPATERFWEHC